MSIKYINIHTHHMSGEEGILEIINFFPGEEKGGIPLSSCGIHPWFIRDEEARNLGIVEDMALYNRIAAIGECGLDKLSKTSFHLQKRIFIKQIMISEKCGLPLIVHSVKSYNEILEIKKNLDPSIPWIIHGFNGSINTALQLISMNCYLSIGHLVLNPETKISKNIHKLPADRIFLESDDDRKVSIKEIYSKVSELLNIDLNDLSEIIIENFRKVFSHLNI